MKKLILIATLSIATLVNAQQKTASVSYNKNPKLVVGIVVDQMRWDYLYRFADLYKNNGGFKRLMNGGFSCDNTFVPYLPTVTACGHTCVYTGSVPAIHGITGNNWYDNNLQRTVYCTEDKSVQAVGSNAGEAGQMSPNNVLVTTVTDELRLASNFRNKVIGISIKDRGAIIPAGHSANAAYWYDTKSGNFITSTFYMNELPKWMQNFNNKKKVDSLYGLNWKLSLSKDIYEKYCDTSVASYTNKPFGKDAFFPYNLDQFKAKDYGRITVTPFANTLLAELAMNTLAEEKMGMGSDVDFLAVSFSAPDYVGHSFGPNSWELLDTYVKLDETIGNLLDYLDKTYGKNQYTVFLTADHAGAHIPEYLQKHNIPGGRWDDGEIKSDLNNFLQSKYKQPNFVAAVMEHDVYLNHPLIDSLKKIDLEPVKQDVINYLLKKDVVLTVVDKKQASQASVPAKIKEMVINGYNPARSGDLQIIVKSGVMDAGKTGMSHGVWNAYDAHIPLLFYGWGIKQGSLKRETYMIDIAPTVAALLQIQMPSGSIGKVITEVLK